VKREAKAKAMLRPALLIHVPRLNNHL